MRFEGAPKPPANAGPEKTPDVEGIEHVLKELEADKEARGLNISREGIREALDIVLPEEDEK